MQADVSHSMRCKKVVEMFGQEVFGVKVTARQIAKFRQERGLLFKEISDRLNSEDEQEKTKSRTVRGFCLEN